MQKMVAVAALSLAGAASPALAQTTYVRVTQTQSAPYIAYPAVPEQQYDPYIPYAPVPLDVNVFDGVRIEAQLGYDHLGPADEDGIDGLSYGGEAGFDVALGSSAIIGGYGGVEGSTGKECDVFAGNTRVCLKSGRSFTAGGRIGFLLSPQTLLYAKGGYTNGRLEATATNRAIPGLNFREYQNLDGFHVGGGLEAAFGRHAYGKIEYVYTRLSGLESIDPATGTTSSSKVDRHQVKAGIGLRM